MKNIFKIIIPIGLIVSGCTDENLPDVENTGESKVVDVSYPTVTLNGSSLVYMQVGGTFVDSGATVIDDVTGGVSQIPATTSELDVNTEGIYAVRYSAKNANGFFAEAVRTILVLNFTPPAGLDPNYDISGNYLRAATGVIATVTKVDNGLYVTSHVGGSTPVPAYFITPDETSIEVPVQTTFNGLNLEGTDENFTPGPPITIKYRVMAAGFGTGLRTFVKQ